MQMRKREVSWQVNKDLEFLNALNHFHLELMRGCLHVEFPQESSPTYDEENYDLLWVARSGASEQEFFFFFLMEISFTTRTGLTDKPVEAKF